MIAYLDSSIFLRIVLSQPNPLREFKTIELAIVSRVFKLEVLATLNRLFLDKQLTSDQLAQASIKTHALYDSCEVVPLNEQVLLRAEENYPVPLGSLDAIHLASALLYKHARVESERFFFLTHDLRLARAAQNAGLTVLGV